MKRILLALAVVVGLALAGGPAGAQYEDVFSATISDLTVFPGQVVTIEGVCPGDDSVAITMGGISVGSIAVADDDTFSGQVTVPQLAPGTYTTTAECAGEVLSAEITVLAADDGTTDPGPVGDDALARTGGNGTETLVKLGGGLLLAGGAVALVSAKRRAATA
jgi:hypothetical protein